MCGGIFVVSECTRFCLWVWGHFWGERVFEALSVCRGIFGVSECSRPCLYLYRKQLALTRHLPTNPAIATYTD